MAHDIVQFMARVVPWPAPGEMGVVNLHWFKEAKDGKRTFFSGRPFTSPEKLVETALWMCQHPERGYRDLYFCLSQQSMFTTSTDGKYLKAIRNRDNVVSLKSVWLDIDVKEGAYTSTEEATTALVEFCNKYEIARPNALVRSGSGGLHCYWISPDPMTLEVWRKRAAKVVAAADAFGLKYDRQCSIDPARVLRVPGTKNYKSNPPKGVSLSWLEGIDVQPI